jgi:hypothetical protein
MPTKSNIKTRTKAGVKNKKSKLSTKLIAAIIIGIVALWGLVVIYNSFASGPTPYLYSYNSTCPKKTTNINVKTNRIATNTGADIVTLPYDTSSDCLKNSAEEQSYRLYRATYGKQPDYKSYSELVQKMAGDRIPVPELVPQSFLDQYKGKSDAEFVTKVFQNVLYRTPGDNGASWAADMKKNGWSRRDAVFIISSSAESREKNIGPFSAFIKSNPEAVKVIPVAQNAQNARDEEAARLVDGMRLVNYSILVLRNEINSAGNYANSKPKQIEVARLMQEFSKGKEKFDSIYKQSIEKNRDLSNGISINRINTLNSKADEYLKSSWTGTVEAGQRTEKYRVDEENARIAAQNRAIGSGNASRGSSGNTVSSGSSSGGGNCGGGYTQEQCNYFAALRLQGQRQSAQNAAQRLSQSVASALGSIRPPQVRSYEVCRKVNKGSKTLFSFRRNPYTGLVNYSKPVPFVRTYWEDKCKKGVGVPGKTIYYGNEYTVRSYHSDRY